MNERTRAPTRTADPTLTAYLADEGPCVDVAVTDPYEDGVTAHRITGRSAVACGGLRWSYTQPAFVARWVCKPCQRCFPEASDG